MQFVAMLRDYCLRFIAKPLIPDIFNAIPDRSPKDSNICTSRRSNVTWMDSAHVLHQIGHPISQSFIDGNQRRASGQRTTIFSNVIHFQPFPMF